MARVEWTREGAVRDKAREVSTGQFMNVQIRGRDVILGLMRTHWSILIREVM